VLPAYQIEFLAKPVSTQLQNGAMEEKRSEIQENHDHKFAVHMCCSLAGTTPSNRSSAAGAN
jgi:hypothetical protein